MPQLSADDPRAVLVCGKGPLVDRKVGEVATWFTDRDVPFERISAVEVRELPDMLTPSLFGGHRGLLVRDVEKLPKAEMARLVELVGNLPDDVVVVAQCGDLRRAGKLKKAVESCGRVVKVAVPREFDTRGWVQLAAEQLRAAGIDADRDAPAALVAAAGTDENQLIAAIARLASHRTEGPVSAADVERVCGAAGTRGAFAAADALVAGDPAELAAQLHGLRAQGTDAFAVLGAFAFRVRQMLQASGSGQGLSAGQRKFVSRQAQALDEGTPQRWLESLADLDVELKRTSTDPWAVLTVRLLAAV